ncbi:MAG: hypothetical protein LBN20_05920, partial [Endomicrobium sp.]|nr:hypothetical protein [Endomicrobium sp.]
MKKLFLTLISIPIFSFLVFAQGDFIGAVSIDNGAKQSISIHTDSNGVYVYQLPKNFEGNKIVLEFNNMDIIRNMFDKGESIIVNNPNKVVLFIEQNKIKNRIDEYIVIGDDGKTLALYSAKKAETYAISIKPASFYSQYNKNKFDAEEKVRLAKLEQEQKEFQRMDNFKKLIYENPLNSQNYKDFTPQEIFDAFSSYVDPVQSVANISSPENGKLVYFEAIQIFQKRGNDAFLFNLNNTIFYGSLSPDCKRGVYKDRQVVKICGVIDGTHSYTTIFNEIRTIPKVIIYAIFPN